MSPEAEDYKLKGPVRRIEGDVLTEMEFNIPNISSVFVMLEWTFISTGGVGPLPHSLSCSPPTMF